METEAICRLCLKRCNDFEVIEETRYEVLNVLLLTLDLAITHEPVICKSCAENLQKCFAFKIAALYIDDKGYVNNVALDICLFCKKPTEFGSFIFLNSEELDIALLKALVEQYFPELNLHTIMSPILCTTCHEVLQGNFAFIIGCMEVEQRIRKYRESIGSNSKGQVELGDVATLVIGQKDCRSSDVKIEENWIEESGPNNDCGNGIKMEDGGSKNNVPNGVKVEEMWGVEAECDNIVGQTVKMENVAEFDTKCLHEEIKIEVRDTISECIEEVVRKWGSYYKQISSEEDISRVKVEASNNRNRGKTEKKRRVEKEKEENTESEKGSNFVLRKRWINIMATTGDNTSPQRPVFFSKTQLRAMITRTNVSGEKKYQCAICKFVAKAKCSMNRHMSIHQDPAEVTLYQCPECPFKTKYKGVLASHVKYHKDPSLIPVYKCQHCPFATRIRNSLRLHMVKHKDSPGVTMFECHTCGYKTCHKKSIKNHVLSHSRPKAVPKLHKCDKCSYETMKKNYFTNHLLIHMHPSEVTMYKCEFCEYESKIKGKCIIHMQSHREPVQCGYCDFRSKYTAALNKHLRKVHDVKVTRPKRKMNKKV